MYKVNDTIMYGSQGVCRITGITEKKICGNVRSYYVLMPVGGGTCTIYAPVGSESAQKKMRRLLSADEIYEIIRSMPKEDTVWIEDERERREVYKEILAGEDRARLVKMIRAVYLHKKELEERGKKLHICDERFFKDAEKILYDEFAAVLDLKPSDVTGFIEQQIELGKL